MKGYKKIINCGKNALRKLGLWREHFDPIVIEKSQENLVYNPLNCKVGSLIKINYLDYRDLRLSVREILEHTIFIHSKQHKSPMVDYVLTARPIGQPEFSCRLRMRDSGAIVLHIDDEFGFNDEFYEIAKEKNIEVSSGESVAEYWRVNDSDCTYLSKIKRLFDENSDGKVCENDVSEFEIEFWDFSRIADVEGVECEEFLYVEMSKKDGWFQLWCGTEINPENIESF